MPKDTFAKDLNSIFGTNEFRLYTGETDYAYKDGQKTNEVIGSKYEIGVPDECVRFTVKVPCDLVIDTQQIEDAKKGNFVYYCKFKNAKAIPYDISFGQAKVTVKAESIDIIKKEK